MRAVLVVVLAACGSDRAPAQDAPPDVPIVADAAPDAPAVGDPCTPDYSTVITACSPTAWCVVDDNSPPYPDGTYHCQLNCDHSACPAGTHRVDATGNHCYCQPN
jgi:hypothetical protein